MVFNMCMCPDFIKFMKKYELRKRKNYQNVLYCLLMIVGLWTNLTYSS